MAKSSRSIDTPMANLPLPGDSPAAAAAALMEARRTVLPKRLGGPGPSAAQLRQILEAAASAPDHGQLLPWRFVQVPDAARPWLADVFGQALQARDTQASAEQLAQARDKAFRAPVLLLVVVDTRRGDPEVDLYERLVSTGCAVQNMLLMATAFGYGSALTSGKALKAQGLRALFGLEEGEHALCFASIGNVVSRKPGRPRPVPNDYVGTLQAPGRVVPGFESTTPRKETA